jgi:hypothetical protein
MNKTIRLLATLLGIQLLFALGLQFTGTNLAATASNGNAPLITIDKDKVDHFTIEGPDAAKVILTKVEGNWQLPERHNFPADANKVKRLLGRLEGLKRGQPVTTTSGAHSRFKVTDDTFERRITLAAGGQTLARLYLGTSPGIRQVHARVDDQKPVYAVELETYDVPAAADGWEDKTLLEIPKTEIQSIDVAGLHLARMVESVTTKGSTPKDSGPATKGSSENSPEEGVKPPAQPEPTQPAWQATGLVKDEIINRDAVNKLAGLLADLRFSSVAGWEAKVEYGLDEPILRLSLMRKGGQQVEYLLGKTPDKEEYTLKVSTRPEYFRLPTYTAKPLINAAKRETLLATKTESKDEASAH